MNKLRFWAFTLLLVSPLLLPMRVATAQLKATLEGHTDNVWSVAFSPVSQMLASGSWDQTVRLWDIETEQLLHIFTGHTDAVMSVTFSLDGKTLASGSWDGTIRLWNPNTGKLKRTLNDHRGGVASVVFSPDGTMLASASADQTILLWNTTTWQVERTLTGHTHVVDVVVFSSDGNTLASGSRDKTVRLWNPHTKQLLHTLTGHTSDITRMAFSLDGDTLASGGMDKTIHLWNPHAGRLKTTLPDQDGWVNPVAFGADGVLAIGGQGISLWDVDTEEYKSPLIGDIGNALSIVFSPDGKMIASGSADNLVRLWDFNPSDHEIPSVDTNGMVRLVYFVPNDRPARPDRIPALHQLIKDAQQFFADEMHRHGFGNQTFIVETDKNGEPVVHHIDGKFKEEYYDKDSPDFKVWEELLEHFDDSDLQHVYFIAIDLSSEILDEACGLGGVIFYPIQGDIGFGPAGKAKLRHRDITIGEEVLGGFALIPASGPCFGDNGGTRHSWGATLHELGHAFGLYHDYREGTHSNYVMASTGQPTRLSKCAAEWLSASRFFNTKQSFQDTPGEIQLLSLRNYSQDTISLRFKVTDADGLHQIQLEIFEGFGGGHGLLGCKRLNGKTSTVESVVRTSELVDRVVLQIIDVGGNITWATLPLQLDEAVSAQNVLDVNSDGVVNILDLTPFVSRFGQSRQDPADVNEDGIIDIVDLLLVAADLSSVPQQAVETFTSADIQNWLTDAKQLEVENATLKKGIVLLEHLLAEIALSSKTMEIATSPLRAIFVGHTNRVWSVAFSPDGGTLASSSLDGTIRLWNLHTAQHQTTLIGHMGTIRSVAFSPDGDTLASGSWDKTIRLWNPHTGKLKETLTGHAIGVSAVSFNHNGTTLASGSADQTIRLWNTTTWQVERTLPGHTGLVESVAFSPDGAMLASGSRDKTIRLWDSHTGKHIRTLPGYTNEIWSVAFSPDGTTLAGGGLDGTIQLWNPHTGQLKRTLPNQTSWVNPVAFSPDEKTLVIGNRGISLWDIETGQYKEPLAGDIGGVLSVAFSIDGTMLASGSGDGTVRLWDFTPADTSSEDTNGDINGDGDVNILDLVVIASELGNEGQNLRVDVNGDGVVNILDLILVAGMFDGAAAAPSAQPQTPETLTAVEVQGWLTDARSLEIKDPIMKRGIIMLEQLLLSLTPKETELLANYPNPFNPETWIPYRLAEDASITLTIYDGSGQVVRIFEVGHRIASAYESRSKAAHWDGRNDLGEQVASGVYFYTLTAGDFSATRKMLILK